MCGLKMVGPLYMHVDLTLTFFDFRQSLGITHYIPTHVGIQLSDGEQQKLYLGDKSIKALKST